LSPAVNTSNQTLVDLLSGVYPGIMSLTLGIVDARDVALAHIRALEKPAAAGRYLCVAENIAMRDLVDWLRQNGYEQYRLPKFKLDNAPGDVLIKFFSYLQPRGVGQYLRSHIGRTPRVDTSKIQKDLDLTFRSLETTFSDTMDDLKKWGHLPELDPVLTAD
jgi:dihydroflavonol-4-reductase